MAFIALRGPHQLALEVVPGASLYFEVLTPECGRECLETGDCGPARHVGAGRAPASATWLGEVGAGSIEIPAFWGGVRACAQVP